MERGHALGTGALPSDFTPQTQDRYAVWLMEGEPGRFGPKPECLPAPSALGYIRQGDIDQAVSLLRSVNGHRFLVEGKTKAT
jgi:muramidase (phage lysozyme)